MLIGRLRLAGEGRSGVRSGFFEPVAAAAMASTSVSMPVFFLGALAVEVRSALRFSEPALGLAIAAYFAAAACASVPAGRLAEAIGGPRQMRASVLVAALALVGLALARSLPELVVALVVAGLASSAAQPAVNLFLSRAVAPGRQGSAFGIKQASVPLATLLAGLAVPAVALTVGWRFAFGGAAAAAMAVAATLPRSEGRVGASSRHVTPDPAPLTRLELAALWLLAGAFALGVGAATALASFLVEAGVHDGMSRASAGLLAALGGASGIAARVLVGFAADRRGGGHLRVVAAMLASGAAGFGLLALGRGPGLWAGAVLAYGLGWGWNGLFNFAVVRTHPHAPGRATGITQTGGRAGGVLGPLAFGFLVSGVSFRAAWALTGLAALGAAGGMLVGRRLLLAARGPAARPDPTGARDGAERAGLPVADGAVFARPAQRR